MSHFILKQKIKLEYFYSSLRKSKTVSLASLIIKNIGDWFSRFPVKLIYSIVIGSESNSCCLLKWLLK